MVHDDARLVVDISHATTDNIGFYDGYLGFVGLEVDPAATASLDAKLDNFEALNSDSLMGGPFTDGINVISAPGDGTTALKLKVVRSTVTNNYGDSLSLLFGKGLSDHAMDRGLGSAELTFRCNRFFANAQGGQAGDTEVRVSFNQVLFDAGTIIDAQHNWWGTPIGLTSTLELVEGAPIPGIFDASFPLAGDPLYDDDGCFHSDDDGEW